MNFVLDIPKISFDVIIGYYEQERLELNPVEISISLTYKKIPNSCLDDNLDKNPENTIRYDEVITSIIEFAKDKNFYTVEKWCFEILQFIIKKFKLNDILISLKLKFTKKNILIPEADEGISFTIEEKF